MVDDDPGERAGLRGCAHSKELVEANHMVAAPHIIGRRSNEHSGGQRRRRQMVVVVEIESKRERVKRC